MSWISDLQNSIVIVWMVCYYYFVPDFLFTKAQKDKGILPISCWENYIYVNVIKITYLVLLYGTNYY